MPEFAELSDNVIILASRESFRQGNFASFKELRQILPVPTGLSQSANVPEVVRNAQIHALSEIS